MTKDDVSVVYGGYSLFFKEITLVWSLPSPFISSCSDKLVLLDRSSAVMRHRPFPRGPLWDGLVIGDYFVMSSEKIAAAPSAARPVAALDCAEETCRAHQVKGSDDKTVRSADHFQGHWCRDSF